MRHSAPLHAAGVITLTSVGNEQYFSVDRRRWATFLGLEDGPIAGHRDWPQLLAALRRVLRWL